MPFGTWREDDYFCQVGGEQKNKNKQRRKETFGGLELQAKPKTIARGWGLKGSFFIW